jgi:drug/metabolite transporter (DMT)-like permease
MIAVLGGLGAAVLWALSNLSSSRSTRMIGATSVLSWVMIVSLVLNLGAIAVTRTPITLDSSTAWWMAVAGFGNAFGLLLLLAALSMGKVGLATSITSTEGAIAAVYSVLAGEVLPAIAYALLVVIVGGVVLVTSASDPDPLPGDRKARAAVLAVCAALLSGASIYATGHISDSVALVWVLLPPRIIGVVVLAVPLALVGRLRLTRQALPYVVATGVAELAGWGSYAFGARDSIAIAAVLSSLFAALATIGAYFLFHERLTRHQVIGIAVITLGVATLTATLT